MSQSAGTSGFAPAWGVHQCPSLQASKGGSIYGSRGRPPDTTGRAVPFVTSQRYAHFVLGYLILSCFHLEPLSLLSSPNSPLDRVSGGVS